MLKISSKELYKRVIRAKRLEDYLDGCTVLNRDSLQDVDFFVSYAIHDFINSILKVKDYGEYFAESKDFNIKRLADNAFDIVYYEKMSYKDYKEELLKLKEIKENA